jgi:SAM-dependent methyltransferase
MPDCPFCGTRDAEFLPFGLDAPVLRQRHVIGGGYRPHAMCPVPTCASLDRERLVYLFLMQRIDLLAGNARVLHVAPEGNLSAALSNRPCYVAADLIAYEGLVQMDITDIHWPDASFDVVVCNHVLEHVVADRTAIREIHRVLEPGGIAILQVPISRSALTTHEDLSVTEPAERLRLFGQSDHVRLYGQDYPDRLRDAGFHVAIYNARAEFGDEVCERFALCKDENVYFCRRPA